MGYTTEFIGAFSLSPALNEDQVLYLQALAETRRMKRNPKSLIGWPDPKREALNLPLGKDGEFYVNANGYAGQGADESILDYNSPPANQPGLWLQWVPTDDGEELIWDGGEKFYHYDEWLVYLNENFFKPWGVKLLGSVRYQGEDFNDRGILSVVDGEVLLKPSKKEELDDCPFGSKEKLKYTVFYTDSFMSGSHRHTLAKVEKIETSDLREWIEENEEICVTQIVDIFEGHLESVDW